MSLFFFSYGTAETRNGPRKQASQPNIANRRERRKSYQYRRARHARMTEKRRRAMVTISRVEKSITTAEKDVRKKIEKKKKSEEIRSRREKSKHRREFKAEEK